MRQKSGCSLVGGQLCQILVLCGSEPVKVPVTVNPTRGQWGSVARGSEVREADWAECSSRLMIKNCGCLYQRVEELSAVPCWPPRFSGSTLSLVARTLVEGLVPVRGDAQPFLSLRRFPPLPLLSSDWLFLTVGGLKGGGREVGGGGRSNHRFLLYVLQPL